MAPRAHPVTSDEQRFASYPWLHPIVHKNNGRYRIARVPQLSACPGDGLGRLRWWAVEQSL